MPVILIILTVMAIRQFITTKVLYASIRQYFTPPIFCHIQYSFGFYCQVNYNSEAWYGPDKILEPFMAAVRFKCATVSSSLPGSLFLEYDHQVPIHILFVIFNICNWFVFINSYIKKAFIL